MEPQWLAAGLSQTETEIANMIQLPEELEKVWYTRQYYGTVSHNSKAVYEKYMGWSNWDIRQNQVHGAVLTFVLHRNCEMVQIPMMQREVAVTVMFSYI